jgi:hypothetical protein
MGSPSHRPVPGGIDESAAVFLSTLPFSESSADPILQTNRLSVNSGIPLEFENEFFKGRIVILHRVPEDYKGPYRYREFFAQRKRRWELRWQGVFKKPISSPIVFGAEILSSRIPKRNFASRALLSLLLKFSGSLARNRGADLYTNIVDDVSAGDCSVRYFHFPVHSSDLILSTQAGEVPPDISEAAQLQSTPIHADSKSVFKNCVDIDISCVYTFVFYSMYADFVSWDVCNVPLGINGMSLNRLVGNQPISVVMRSKVGSSTEEYFRILLANRCTSPDWSSFITVGERFNVEKMSEFFSIVSWNSNEEPYVSTSRRKMTSSRRRRFFSRITQALASCFRAPMSFVMRRSTSSGRSSSTSRRRPSGTAPLPDSRRLEFVTPISEESEAQIKESDR